VALLLGGRTLIDRRWRWCGGGGGGITDGVDGGGSDVLVVAGLGADDGGVPSTATRTTARTIAKSTAASTTSLRRRLNRTGGGTAIVAAGGNGSASTRVGGRVEFGCGTPDNAARIASALGKRHCGSRAIACSIVAASPGSTSGRNISSGGGTSSAIARASATRFSCGNGLRPDSAS
jgi:hypothetical protein